MEMFKVLEMRIKDADVKNRYYVYQICYVNKAGKPRYRLVKQCSSLERAKAYADSKESQV